MGFHLTKVSGMLWPNPLEEWCDELESRLRHDTGGNVQDRLMAASLIAAYRELVRCPEKKRETVVRGLKEVAQAEQRILTAPPHLPTPPEEAQSARGGTQLPPRAPFGDR